MTDQNAQWLFLMTDIEGEADPAVFLSTYDDGQNVAFLFNVSTTDGRNKVNPAANENSLSCIVSAVIRLYVDALHQAIRAEETRYYQTTETDWVRKKPSAGDRSNEIFRAFKVNK